MHRGGLAGWLAKGDLQLHHWGAVWEAAEAPWAVHCFYPLLIEDMRAALLGARHQAEPALGGCCVSPAPGRVATLELGKCCPQHQPRKPFLAHCASSDVHQNRCLSVNTPLPDGNQPNTQISFFPP